MSASYLPVPGKEGGTELGRSFNLYQIPRIMGLEILNSEPTKAAACGMKVGQAEASRSGLCLDGVKKCNYEVIAAKILVHQGLLCQAH